MFPIREWKKTKNREKKLFSPSLSAYFCLYRAAGAAVHPVQPKTLLSYESSPGKKIIYRCDFCLYILYNMRREKKFFYLRAFNFFGVPCRCRCLLLLLYLFIYCVIMIRFPFYFSVNTIDGRSLELGD